MTAQEYRDAIEQLGLNQQAAGRFLGLNSYRSSRRYALGESPVPHATAMLLRLMIKKRMKPAQVCKLLGIEWEG